MLSKAVQFLRKAAADPNFSKFLGQETTPGPSVQTEAQWEDFVRQTVGSECATNSSSRHSVLELWANHIQN